MRAFEAEGGGMHPLFGVEGVKVHELVGGYDDLGFGDSRLGVACEQGLVGLDERRRCCC